MATQRRGAAGAGAGAGTAGREGDAEATAAALQANQELVAELQDVAQALAQQEARLAARIQSIRRRQAMRRAKQAMDALLPRRRVLDSSNTRPAPYEKPARDRRRRLAGVVPRSYIRQVPSFFHDDEAQAEAERERRKRQKRRKRGHKEASETEGEGEGAALRALVEPPPNTDTLLLRARSHEAFVAKPARVFSAKERQAVRAFAEHYRSQNDLEDTAEIPLSAWNELPVWQRSGPSRQQPLERSGFACKLWYELHEAPTLRLCAWTKKEDAALARLATGQEDAALVNRWQEIARRMPEPGRPAVHCLTRYQTTLCADNVRSSFTADEDAVLREAVRVFGEKWNVIADLLDGRVPEQLRHRWQLSLAPGVRQGKFSIVEDRRLLLAIRAYLPRPVDGGDLGESSGFSRERVVWNEVSHHVPGRTQPALRDRFLNSLNPELSFRKWSKREDELILQRVRELGPNASGLWARLAAELGDRTDNQVARRWKSLVPEAEARRRQMQLEEERAGTTAVFRKPSMGRRKPHATTKHVRRSSYNGQDSQDTPESSAAEQTGGSQTVTPSDEAQQDAVTVVV